MTIARTRRTNRVPGHRITWWVWAYGADGQRPQKLRHTSKMRGAWGYDATCSCGNWESRTGGATRTSVERDVWDHMYDVATDAQRDALVGLSTPNTEA